MWGVDGFAFFNKQLFLNAAPTQKNNPYNGYGQNGSSRSGNHRVYGQSPVVNPVQDQDGWSVNKRNKIFTSFTHTYKWAKFGSDNTQEVTQDSEKAETTFTVEMPKRQLDKKFGKHKEIASENSGKNINNVEEFRDVERDLLTNNDESVLASPCILLGENGEPTDQIAIINHRSRYCQILKPQQRVTWNPNTGTQERKTIHVYVGSRQLTQSQYSNFKSYGVIGSDGKDISMATHDMTADQFSQSGENNTSPPQ